MNLIKKDISKSYTDASQESVGERMIRLIYEEQYSLSQLASFFKGMNALETLRFFAGIDFDLGIEYLKGPISSAIDDYNETIYLNEI